MRAVLMTAVGGPELLQLRDVPEPELSGDRDIKVRLAAARINPVDYKLGRNQSGSEGAELRRDVLPVHPFIGAAFAVVSKNNSGRPRFLPVVGEVTDDLFAV